MATASYETAPKNRREFLAFADSIDRFLADDAIPIHARPMAAAEEACRRLAMSVVLFPMKQKPSPRQFSGRDLIAHLYRWYRARYGDRLKIDMSLGAIVVLLRGAPWLINLPLVFGKFRFGCVRNLKQYSPDPQFPTINILDLVVDATPSFRRSLIAVETENLCQAFRFGMNAAYKLKSLDQVRYIPEAIGDARQAVACIMATPPDCASSRWHSSQMVEKLIKAHLAAQSIDFPTIHELSRLVRLMHRSDSIGINADDVALVQANAGMRYGDETVTLSAAVEAHAASLRLACSIPFEDLGPG
jgi:hypothetical protein